MFDFEKSVKIALRTWYPKDHKLHLNPHHPLGKLLGEWGELLDNYMKSVYKPSYVFEPLEELGDIWYYLRILCSLKKLNILVKLEKVTLPEIDFVLVFSEASVDTIIATMQYVCARGFLFQQGDSQWLDGVTDLFFNIHYSAIKEICNRQNITFQQLTDSNWEKLKPGSERGEQWARATDYVEGKVAKE